uniref:Uncharacterized protein n=1 Tax=Amphimedon queenslandica TaxID=400682 RepID=A0A1X7TX33_AMPQE
MNSIKKTPPAIKNQKKDYSLCVSIGVECTRDSENAVVLAINVGSNVVTPPRDTAWDH